MAIMIPSNNTLKDTIQDVKNIISTCDNQDSTGRIICKNASIKLQGTSNEHDIGFSMHFHNKNNIDISLVENNKTIQDHHFQLPQDNKDTNDIQNALLEIESYADNLNFTPLSIEINMCGTIEGNSYHFSVAQQICDNCEVGKDIPVIQPPTETESMIPDHTFVA